MYSEKVANFRFWNCKDSNSSSHVDILQVNIFKNVSDKDGLLESNNDRGLEFSVVIATGVK